MFDKEKGIFNKDVQQQAQKAKFLSDLANGLTRTPRFLSAAGLPLGIFGTFMGLYNKQQIDLLRTDLKDTMTKHNRLVEIVQHQENEIGLMNDKIKLLRKDLETFTINDPAYISSMFLLIENRIRKQLRTAAHTIQMAMQRRLSVDLLGTDQLRYLYDKIRRKADRTGYSCLINHHSDLFQLETSYFHDGSNVHLLIHVPMIPEDSLLRLFRLHPFPLPLSKEHMLIPDVDYDVLAISPGLTRLATVLNYVDLMSCHNVNNIYLCEQQGVLKTNINGTCLGSLYLQDFEMAKQLCPLKIHDAEEMVEQLLNNWFLAYSPKSLMAPVICHNGTNSEIHLKKGFNNFHLSPGCKTKLEHHVVVSDISLKLDGDMMHYEWTWDQNSFDIIPTEDIDPLTNEMQRNGLTNPSFSELLQVSMERKRTPGWLPVLMNFLGVIILSAAFCGTLGYLYYRYRQQLKELAAPAIDKVRNQTGPLRSALRRSISFSTNALPATPTQASAPDLSVSYRAGPRVDDISDDEGGFPVPPSMTLLRSHFSKPAVPPKPFPRPSKLYPEMAEDIDLNLLKNNFQENVEEKS
jgi:hypothetical protein